MTDITVFEGSAISQDVSVRVIQEVQRVNLRHFIEAYSEPVIWVKQQGTDRLMHFCIKPNCPNLIRKQYEMCPDCMAEDEEQHREHVYDRRPR